jgi:hypothetical protein
LCWRTTKAINPVCLFLSAEKFSGTIACYFLLTAFCTIALPNVQECDATDDL